MRNIFISIFCVVATIAFILCGSCGFVNEPQIPIAKQPQAPKFKYSTIYIQCDNVQFCAVLESEIYFNKIAQHVITTLQNQESPAASIFVTENKQFGEDIKIIRASPPVGVNVDLSMISGEYCVTAKVKDQSNINYGADACAYSDTGADLGMPIYMQKNRKTNKINTIYMFDTSALNLLYKNTAKELIMNLNRSFYWAR